MAPRVFCNNKGFSLIELLVATFIIMISMLAVLSSMLTATRMNVENDVRNTAVRLTNQTAETLLTLQWAEVVVAGDRMEHMDADLSAGVHTRIAEDAEQDRKGYPVLSQSIRNFRQDYRVQWTIEDVSIKTKRITITVAYTRNGQDLANEAVIFRDRRREVRT